MPRIGAVAVIAGGTDDDGVAVSRHRYRPTGVVEGVFAVDVVADLCPRAGSECVDAGMPRIGAVAVIGNGADDDCVAVSGNRHRETGEVVGVFTVDVVANLCPRAGSECVDAGMPRKGAVAVIEGGADDDGVAVSRHCHRPTGEVAGVFAVDVGAELIM